MGAFGPDRRVYDMRRAPRGSQKRSQSPAYGDVGDRVASELFGDLDSADPADQAPLGGRAGRLMGRSTRHAARSVDLGGRSASSYADAWDNPDMTHVGNREFMSQMRDAQEFEARSGRRAARALDLAQRAQALVEEEFGLDPDLDDEEDGDEYGYTESAYYGLYSGTDELTQQIAGIEARVVDIVKKYVSVIRIPKLLSLNKQRDQVIDSGASSNSPQAVDLENQGLGLLSGVTQPTAGELWTLARKRDNLRRASQGRSQEPVGTPPRLV